MPPAPFCPPRKLGVGFPYLSSVPSGYYARRDRIDFVEIGPDTLCSEQAGAGPTRLAFDSLLLTAALEATAGLPMVVHGVELSIGSAIGWNNEYVETLDQFHAQRPFLWHSEHLGFLVAEGPDGQPMNTGVPLPVPFTSAALDMLVPRAQTLCRRYGVPFLLENTVHYLPELLADEGRDEAAFLNELVDRSGCGLLLDLYNLYCNGLHHGFDPRAALDRLRLDRVVEIHIAGGDSQDGFLMDSHSEIVPEPVWRLLAYVVPRAPNLAGIVYELLDEAFGNVGPELAYRQLERAKQVWNEHS